MVLSKQLTILIVVADYLDFIDRGCFDGEIKTS